MFPVDPLERELQVCSQDALAAELEVSEVCSGFQGCVHHLHAYVGALPEYMRGEDHTGHKAPQPSPGHGAYFLKGIESEALNISISVK